MFNSGTHTIILLGIINLGPISGYNFCLRGCRVVGGAETVITKYPSTAVLLESSGTYLMQKCGGTIINEKYVLTAAHCFDVKDSAAPYHKKYRIRVGSSAAHTGGFVHEITNIIIHPKWNADTHDSDIALMRTANDIIFSYTKQPALLASADYHLPDDGHLWATGWGFVTERGPASEILRHVHVKVINQEICKERYQNSLKITENMMCSGWLDIGGGDQCTHDSGSPLYHHGVVIGIASIGIGCGDPSYPAINVRISSFVNWILANTGTAEIFSSRQLTLDLRISLFL